MPGAVDGVKPYPKGFVYGRGAANPSALSLSGLKISRCLKALERLPEEPGQVLELGCGGGQYLRAIQRFRPELELAAVDLNPEAVEATRDISGLACLLADAGELPFAPASMAAVVGFDILEHVPEPGKVLAEASRVLRPSGLLHLYVPCEGNPGTVYVKRGHGVKARWGGHVQQFTTERVLDLLRAAGFEIVETRHADYWLTQQLDHLFFSRLDRSPHPEKLWAAQALSPDRSLSGWILRIARRFLSAVAWLEGSLRHSARGAMGVHVTAIKKDRSDRTDLPNPTDQELS